MTIKQFNELYEMYMEKPKEDLAMLLTLRDTNEDNIDIKIPGQSGIEETNYGKEIFNDYGDTTIKIDNPAEDRKRFDDIDLFRVHTEDYDFTNTLGTYCIWKKDHKCVRGSNSLCDGCGHMPRLYATTSTADMVDWVTTVTTNC